MCQMPNIWHIWHTKHKNGPSSSVLNVLKLWNMLQYSLIFESVWMKMLFPLIVFYSSFSLHSHHFIPFFSLSSLILPQTFLSTHLFFHSFFFSLLFLFSLLFSLTAPLDANLCCCGFFLGSDLMGGFGSGWLFSLPFSLAAPPDTDL